jgi:hypothetical protein
MVITYVNDYDGGRTDGAAISMFSYAEYRPQTVTVVGSYFVPDGAENVSVHVLLKTDKSYNAANLTEAALLNMRNTAGDKAITNFTATKQFVLNVSRGVDTRFTMGAMIYVTYDLGGVEHTI